MFGNQALNAWQTRAGMEQARNQFGLGLLGTMMQGYGMQPYEQTTSTSKPWWETALGVAGTVAPFFSNMTGGYHGGVESSVPNSYPGLTPGWNYTGLDPSTLPGYYPGLSGF
jgi:hypothetical protein